MNIGPPFRSEIHQNRLVLTLDTPGGDVNVFTREAASQLCAVLGGRIPSEVHAVVVRSGKPRSFVNGVGLLMAGTVKSVDDALRMRSPIRDAYCALRNCAVPTIAAIEGNCFGCGVELALHCQHRIAADSFDTQFYMTEIAEYLFIPTFGGTQDLPRLVGLDPAVDFVLSGSRWSTRKAVELGLVDWCFAPGSLDDALDRFVRSDPSERRRIAKRAPRLETETSRARIVEACSERIAKLPPAYRDVYLKCLELMAAAATKERLDESDYIREAVEAAHSVLAGPSRSAWPFFFIRQMAAALATERTPGARSQTFEFTASDPSLTDLTAELTAQSVVARAAPDRGPSGAFKSPFDFVAYAGTDSFESSPARVAVSLGPSESSFDAKQPVVLHLPLRSIGMRVAEIAAGRHPDRELERELAVALTNVNYTVIRSRPQDTFVLDGLLTSWIAPQVIYLSLGGSPADLAASLRAFGFTRFAGDWIGRLDEDVLCKLLQRRLASTLEIRKALRVLPNTMASDGAPDPIAIDALIASLGAFVSRTLRSNYVSHVAFLDAAARDIVDFPLLHTSLCRYFTIAQAQRFLRNDRLRQLLAEEDAVSLADFVSVGREHYVAQHH